MSIAKQQTLKRFVSFTFLVKHLFGMHMSLKLNLVGKHQRVIDARHWTYPTPDRDISLPASRAPFASFDDEVKGSLSR